MQIQGIVFPDELLEALENGKLVVFAGAGVSKGKPTKLPNFVQLTNQILEGTGESVDDDTLMLESVLGRAKEIYNINVNRLAAELLNRDGLRPNIMHKAIIDLFPSDEGIKVVTTNYDLMFEKVIKRRKKKIAQYSAPALPLGQEFSGVVHVHGDIRNPQYMVVTDEDFGVAYMTEGYTSRFLLQLFSSYTVLFVGYSYNDTIMKYLTRAVTRKNKNNLFVLTDEEKEKWDVIGVCPVTFPKEDYVRLQNALEELGVAVRRKAMEWKLIFDNLSDTPPVSPTDAFSVEYCSRRIKRASYLAEKITGRKWLFWLDKVGVFDTLFVEDMKLEEVDKIWLGWLIEESTKGYNAVELLLLKHIDGIYNREATKEILSNVSVNGISDEVFLSWIELLGIEKVDKLTRNRIIVSACSRGLYSVAFRMFVMGFQPRFFVRSNGASSDQIEMVIDCAFDYDYHDADYLWSKILPGLDNNIDEKKSLQEIGNLIYSIHERCYGKDGVCDKQGGSYLEALVDIEDNHNLHDDAMTVLCDMFFRLSVLVAQKDRAFLSCALLNYLQSESVLVRRIALKAIRETKVLNTDIIQKTIVDGLGWNHFEGKDQVMLLAQSAFSDFSEKQRDDLITKIATFYNYSGTELLPRELYDWAEWLHRSDDDNDAINRIVSEGESRGFKPRENPDRVFDISCEFVKNTSPLSVSEMKQQGAWQLIDFMKNYHEPFIGINSRTGLLMEFTNCVRTAEIEWILELISKLQTGQFYSKEVFSHLLQGIESSKRTAKEMWQLVDVLSKGTKRTGFTKEISSIMLSVIRDRDTRDSVESYENVFWRCSHYLLETNDDEYHELDDLWLEVCNSTIGIVLICSIWMFSYTKEKSDISRFFDFYDDLLSENDLSRKYAVCVLAGQLDLLFLKDQEWCIQNICPLLEGKDEKDFQWAWLGVVHGNLNWGNVATGVMKHLFEGAFSHTRNWGDPEVKEAIVEAFADYIVLFAGRDVDINNKLIPALYHNVEKDLVKRFINRIQFRVEQADESIEKTVWNSWLKGYIEKRTKGFPVLAWDEEIEKIIEMISCLKTMYSNAVSIVIRFKRACKMEPLFWFCLEKRTDMIDANATALLLGFLVDGYMNSDTIIKGSVEKVYNSIKDKIDIEIKGKLDERIMESGFFLD